MKELLKKIALYGAISSFAFVLAMPVLAREDENRNGSDDSSDDKAFACTMDARQCPDGSFVGRTGPNCEFVCPGVVVGSTTPSGIIIQEKRKEIKEQMEKAREAFKKTREEAKDKFESAREEYKQKVEEAKQDKKDLTASIKETGKDKSQEARAKVLNKAHDLLENTVGAMIKRLEALKNKVDGVKLLDADRAEIVAEINKDIDWLKARNTEIQTTITATTTVATASTTAQTIKDKSKEVKVYWDTVKTTVKRVSGEILAGRLNYIVSKEEALANALTTEIAALKAAGKDVASLEQSLADAKTNIATAKAKIAEAKAKFKTITTLSTVKSAYEEGKEIIKDASGIVKDLHVALIKVRNGANAINGTNGSGAATTTPTTSTTTATTTTP